MASETHFFDMDAHVTEKLVAFANSPITLLAAAVLFAVVLGIFYITWNPRLSKLRIPPVVASPPVVGPLISFLKDPLLLATNSYKKYGEAFTYSIFGLRLTFLVGPEAHVAFFKPDDDVLSQNEAYNYSIPLFGPGVVYDATLERRTEQLKLVHGILKADKLRSYVGQMIEEAELFFANEWGDTGVIDLNATLGDLIILTATRCLMGQEVREHMFAKLSKLITIMDNGTKPISFFFPYLPTSAHRARDQARLGIVQIFTEVIQKRRASGKKVNDILQVFMDYQYKDGEVIKEEHVAGLMIALLFAGQHTSSITSTWTGLFLMKNRKFWNDAVAEQDRVLAESNDVLTPEALKKMDFLHCCIKEGLRMFPPIILLVRKALKDVPYKDMVIPKGDYVFTSPALSGRLPDVFANPDEFDPYRFAAGREEDKKGQYAFLGFGAGKHSCMGEQFAYTQIKTIWSVLLRNFDLELTGPFPKPCYDALLVAPTKPCNIRYTRKKKAAL